METTPIKIGETIAALRRARGLTQEQLADQLGVSAPAVSKWETGSSCPDITLLCPLARALGTTLDGLFQFEETLSDQEAAAQINALLQTAQTTGPEAAEAELESLLRRYPNCTVLKFNGAAACDAFQMFFPAASEKDKTRWRARKQALLEDVRATGSAAYWQSATIQLASLAVLENQLDKAAALLGELPEHPGSATGVWVQYYLKKGETDKALETAQKQLYFLSSQIQTCLVLLMDPRLRPQPQQLLKAGQTSRILARAFGQPDMSSGALMDAYLRLGQMDEAAECFAQYVDTLTGPMAQPDEDLFSPWYKPQEPKIWEATARQMRQISLAAIQEEKDEKYRPLLEHPVFVAALEKLKSSL